MKMLELTHKGYSLAYLYWNQNVNYDMHKGIQNIRPWIRAKSFWSKKRVFVHKQNKFISFLAHKHNIQSFNILSDHLTQIKR
jgi:hypothetical protein